MRKAEGHLALEEVMTGGFIYWLGRVSENKVAIKPTSTNTMVCLGYLSPSRHSSSPFLQEAFSDNSN